MHTQDATFANSCPATSISDKDPCIELYTWNESNGSVTYRAAGAGYYSMVSLGMGSHAPVVTIRLEKQGS